MTERNLTCVVSTGLLFVGLLSVGLLSFSCHKKNMYTFMYTAIFFKICQSHIVCPELQFTPVLSSTVHPHPQVYTDITIPFLIFISCT